VLAKEAATLDFLSDGRFELGLGAGWIRDEYDAMGVAFDPAPVRIARLEEAIALVKAHFGPDPIELRGEHIQVHGYSGAPRPVQQPRPPIIIGGGARRVLTLAGREADIVSLNFNNASGMIGRAGAQTSTAEATAEKLGWVRDGAGDRFGEIEIEVSPFYTAVTDDRIGAAEAFAKVFGLSPDDVLASPHTLIGPVESICDQLEATRAEYGASYFTVSGAAAEAFAPVVAHMTGR
jgi:probable F420-dependent oxidoreductase